MVEALELTSPCSLNDVMELKEYFEGALDDISIDLMGMDYGQVEVTDSMAVSRFVCITDSLGFVKYSNVTELKKFDNILKSFRISSPEIHQVLEKITQNQNRQQDKSDLQERVPETVTLINGLICFVSLDSIVRIPRLLKLQTYDQLTIWSFKKASIRQTQMDDGFKIDDMWYQFSKFKTVLAIDSAGKLLNYPCELFKYLIGSEEDLQSLDEIISVPKELKEVLISFSDQDDQTDNYQKFSVSSLDLFVDKFPRPIYSSQTKMLKTGMDLEINLYSSINSKNNERIFPLQLKYAESDSFIVEGDIEPHGTGGVFPLFSGFEISRKLSESHHSTIYEAFKENELVIVKVIHGDNRNELKFYEFFCNGQVDCNFIERPFKIDDVDGRKPAIFMKFVPKRSDLFEFVFKRDFLPIQTIKKIFLQIVEAIDFLHSHGIIHRDIKDENFLIEHDNLNVKLIDFGSSAFLNDPEIDFTQYVGTFTYAPVEVLKGQPFNGPEQDTWCLGILLYVLCFKEPPFHSAKDILQGILRLPIERPVEVIELIRQMIDPRPKNRPSTKMILSSKFLQ